MAGQGLSLRVGTGAGESDYVTALGIRCRSADGALTTLGAPSLTWRDCGPDEVVTGLRADATSAWVHSTRFLCTPRSQLGAIDRTMTPLDLPNRPQAWSIERRCPLGQAVYAASLTLSSTRVTSVVLHCHSVTAPRAGEWTRLASIGRATVEGVRGRRTWRCADHGVLTGLFGHRSVADTHLSRAGGFCQSTEAVGDMVRFRAGAGATSLPEFPLPAFGSEGTHSTPERAFGATRCPLGMGLVGLSVRRSGRYGATRDILGHCASLTEWTRDPAPSTTPLPIVGNWEAADADAGVVETARCPPGRFLSGYEMNHVDVSEGTVIDEIFPLCRDLRAAR